MTKKKQDEFVGSPFDFEGATIATSNGKRVGTDLCSLRGVKSEIWKFANSSDPKEKK